MSADRKPAIGSATISLRYLQRRPDRVSSFAGRRVRIWSSEHCAYWRPNGNGYTTERSAAGTWFLQNAFHDLRRLGPEKRIWFAFVLPGDTGVEAKAERHWHEALGDVLWWRFPVNEPPYVGKPIDCDWPGYHTHFTPLPPIPHRPRRGSASA